MASESEPPKKPKSTVRAIQREETISAKRAKEPKKTIPTKRAVRKEEPKTPRRAVARKETKASKRVTQGGETLTRERAKIRRRKTIGLQRAGWLVYRKRKRIYHFFVGVNKDRTKLDLTRSYASARVFRYKYQAKMVRRWLKANWSSRLILSPWGDSTEIRYVWRIVHTERVRELGLPKRE